MTSFVNSWVRLAVALAITGLVGCAAGGEAEFESADEDLSLSLVTGTWQRPYCASALVRDFRQNTEQDMVRVTFAADGTYVAVRPSPQVDEACAPGGRCLSEERGSYTLADIPGLSAKRIVLRPFDGVAREYRVTRGLPLMFERPATAAPGAVPGTAGIFYPTSILFSESCHYCADGQRAVQATPGDRASWVCTDGA